MFPTDERSYKKKKKASSLYRSLNINLSSEIKFFFKNVCL